MEKDEKVAIIDIIVDGNGYDGSWERVLLKLSRIFDSRELSISWLKENGYFMPFDQDERTWAKYGSNGVLICGIGDTIFDIKNP